PVRLQGIATFSDPARFLLCLQDGSGGIFIEPGSRPPQIQSGQRIELQGRTDAGDFGRMVKDPEVRILGQGEYPPGGRGTYGRLAGGQEHGQWVRTSGTLRRAYTDPRGLHLELVTGGRRIHAVVAGVGPTNLAGLVGAEVSASGVCAMMCGEDPGQLVKFQLLVPDLQQMSVDMPAPADVTTLPLRSLASVRELRSGLSTGQRVRVRGTVTYAYRGGPCFIQEGDESLLLIAPTETEAQPGELVEVVGFPIRGSYNVVLEDAMVRVLGRGTPPVPRRLLERLADPGTLHTKLVRARGTLLVAQEDAPPPELMLEVSGQVARARWPRHQSGVDQHALQPGAVLELTGVCSVRQRAETAEGDISLLLRSR